MDINNEYAILVFKLRRIVSCNNEPLRKKLEKDYVKSLSSFKKRIEAIENKINDIASVAMKAKDKMDQSDKEETEPKTIIFYGFKNKIL